MAEHQLHGAYVALPVQPENLATALRALPALGFAGCNLTIPHKVAAIDIVDVVEPAAEHIGAVNTVVVQADGSLLGRNTDGAGFIQSLDDATPQWRTLGGHACVIGAGGAARAIITGLLQAGIGSIHVCNRSIDKAYALQAAFGSAVVVRAWSDRASTLDGACLVVNTTNQGMHGEAELDLPLDMLPRTAVVADIVYVPLQTGLLRSAHARGNPCVNGLGMLLNQARLAFAAWFHVMPGINSALTDKLLKSF